MRMTPSGCFRACAALSCVLVLVGSISLMLFHSNPKVKVIWQDRQCPSCPLCVPEQCRPATCHPAPAVSAVIKDDWEGLNFLKLTPKQIVDYLYWTNRSSCRITHDFGGVIRLNPSGLDGQKAICLDSEMAPKAGRCLVYSFGINNEWSFDDTMGQYGCDVYAFDPSMSATDHNRTDRIHFYRMGLGAVDDDGRDSSRWKMKTFESIYRMLEPFHGPGRIVDYVKIDIEGYEWDVLDQMVRSGMLSKIRQLEVEIHFTSDMDLEYYRMVAKRIRAIERAGMTRFDSKAGLWCTPKDGVKALNGYKGPVCFDIAWYQILPF